MATNQFWELQNRRRLGLPRRQEDAKYLAENALTLCSSEMSLWGTMGDADKAWLSTKLVYDILEVRTEVICPLGALRRDVSFLSNKLYLSTGDDA